MCINLLTDYRTVLLPMAKPVVRFMCQECGASHNRWNGKCEGCGGWNTLVEEVIERQLKKYRTKLVTKQQSAASVFKQDFLDAASDDDEEIKIIRSKKFDMKPMYPEDACVQMELLGHDFFVFINAETEDVNVVYKRKGNTYGLIEPEY